MLPSEKYPLELGNLKFLPNCPKGHKVMGVMDGDFCLAEVHIPADTPMREIDAAVRKVFLNQL